MGEPNECIHMFTLIPAQLFDRADKAQYFRIWSGSGHDNETERTFKRYLTWLKPPSILIDMHTAFELVRHMFKSQRINWTRRATIVRLVIAVQS